jgi:hypothetical protein
VLRDIDIDIPAGETTLCALLARFSARQKRRTSGVQ